MAEWVIKMSDSPEYLEYEERVVQETEIHDLLADVEGAIRSLDTAFVRVEIQSVTAEKHRANKQLAEAVKETDHCLGCGEPIDDGGFCGFDCLQSVGKGDSDA
jgi:hypothetical protein